MFKYLFLLLTILFTSCGVFNKAGESYRSDQPLSLTAKINTEIQLPSFAEQADKEISLGGQLRLRRDHSVVISLQKFGFEAVRLYFLPDSIWVVSKLQKTYTTASYSQFNQMLMLPQTLHFGKVQSFFWNDRNQAKETTESSIFLLFPLHLRIEREGATRIRQHKIPTKTEFDMHIGKERLYVDLKLSNVKINYNWEDKPNIPKNYQFTSLESLKYLLLGYLKLR